MQYSSYAIHYDIVPNPKGITLKIWEMEPKKSYQEAQILYTLNYKLASADLAWGILNQHLEMAGVQRLSYNQFNRKGGKVEVAAQPSLSLSPV
jgi:hypothetical protein